MTDTTLMTQYRDNEAALTARAHQLVDGATSAGRDMDEAEAGEHRKVTDDLAGIRTRMDDLTASEKRSADAAAAFERIASRPAERPGSINSQTRGGDWLAAELRALSGSGVTNGGAYTPTEFSSYFFDRLAASSVALASGIRVIQTDRDTLVVPRWTADTTSGWTAEGATIASTDATADQITAVPRKLASLQAISNEALDDSSPALLEVVAAGMVRSVALKYDLGVFEGSGTAPEIRGLKNVAGITTQSLGVNGAALVSLDPIADAIGALDSANAEAGAIVMHPRTWQGLVKIKEVSGSTKPVLQEHAGSGATAVERRIYGVPVFLSAQLSITETQGTSSLASSIYVYQPDQVVAVFRTTSAGVARVERDKSRLFNSDQSELRSILRADLVVPNPLAVVRIAGAL